MNVDACGVLAQLFPVLALLIVVESRFTSGKAGTIRVLYAGTAVGACIGGMVLALIGVNVGGFDAGAAVALWCAFGVGALVATLALVRFMGSQGSN